MQRPRAMAVAAGLVLATLLATPGHAGQCQDDLAKIDAALAAKDVAPDTRAQLEDMRKQAAQLCAAGHEREGLDVTGEAKAMLNIE